MDNHDEQFASDNSSGMCPEALKALLAANLLPQSYAEAPDGPTTPAAQKVGFSPLHR